MSLDKEKTKYTDKSIKSIKVALFCITAILIVYFGCTFLKGLNVFGHKTYYYTVFENLGGLHESTTIALNGYPVGKVTKLTILNTNPTRICAEMLITEEVDLPIDSRFEVAEKDVMGGMIVNLIVGESKTIAHNKDTLACSIASGLMGGLDDLMDQLTSVIASVDTIGLSLKSAFLLDDPDNGGLMLKSTLVNLEASARHLNQILADNEAPVDNIVKQLEQLSITLGEATPQINSIVQNIDYIIDSLAQSNIRTLINDAQATVTNLNEVMAKVERGEGSVGLLMNSDSLYDNINHTVESLNVLLLDLKENPSRYINVTIFGKKDQKQKKE